MTVSVIFDRYHFLFSKVTLSIPFCRLFFYVEVTGDRWKAVKRLKGTEL